MPNKFVLLLIVLLVAYLLGVFFANRFHKAPEIAFEPLTGNATLKPASMEISVTTWNIGYAGMGQESDFYMDMGTQRRPLSGSLVDKNLAGICSELARLDSDIFLLQEVARPSLNTWNRDVYAALNRTLQGHCAGFSPDIEARLLPPPFHLRVGNAVFSKLLADQVELRPLALEPTFELLAFRKTYRMHILRLAGPEQWVFIDVHLSAFDKPELSVREEQLKQVIDFAQAEYEAGCHVVVGGDWNLRIAPTTFPHTTEEQYQFWIRDLPEGVTPEGWTWATDPSTPTVRTAYKPYVAGENMVLIVDGFLVSPNVEILEVRTTDTGFACTDHQPVTARLQAK